jgi:hypothetical protein
MTLAFAGCNQGTPGGPGTTGTSAKQSAYGQADDTFNLSVPVLSSPLQQGGLAETTIGIKRAKNFDSDVALSFSNLPKGVTIEPAKPMIKHGDTDAKITFKAGSDAALGDFTLNVAGHPNKGGDAKVEFKLTVTAKDSFTLSVPRSSALKQGNSETVSIGINRQKTFDQEIALTFSDLPAGVTIEPDSSVIKSGETGAQFTLAATSDASLGTFAIKVTGHPTQGADALSELTLTVAKD